MNDLEESNNLMNSEICINMNALTEDKNVLEEKRCEKGQKVLCFL